MNEPLAEVRTAVHGRETVGKMEKFSVKKPFTVLVAVVTIYL